jgi:hypothetical protein
MSKKPTNPTKADYEKIGRMVESIYESGYINENQTYKMSFIKGLVAGVGGVIGATVVIALLLGILSMFDTVPLVGPFIEKIVETVETQN